MKPISYARHRFPPEVIRYAVWLYLRFTLSYRDVEELLAERGIDVDHVTVPWCGTPTVPPRQREQIGGSRVLQLRRTAPQRR